MVRVDIRGYQCLTPVYTRHVATRDSLQGGLLDSDAVELPRYVVQTAAITIRRPGTGYIICGTIRLYCLLETAHTVVITIRTPCIGYIVCGTIRPYCLLETAHSAVLDSDDVEATRDVVQTMAITIRTPCTRTSLISKNTDVSVETQV